MFYTTSFGTVTPAEMEKFRAWIETRKRELDKSAKESKKTGGKKSANSGNAKSAK